VPRRRCVGCGRIAAKPELVRIAVLCDGDGGRPRAVLDVAGTLPGRGAYVCRGERTGEAARTCVARPAATRSLARTLRCAVTFPAELIESGGR